MTMKGQAIILGALWDYTSDVAILKLPVTLPIASLPRSCEKGCSSWCTKLNFSNVSFDELSGVNRPVLVPSGEGNSVIKRPNPSVLLLELLQK